MINYDYLYDKTRYDRYTQINHFSKQKLCWKIYDDATVLPYAKGHSPTDGGLVDSKGDYIDGSGLHRGMGKAYKVRRVRYIDETVVLLGIWPNIWGHWLTDNIRRLWVLKNKEFMSQYGNCRFLYLPYYHQDIGKNPKEFLDILDIEKVTLECEDEVTKYKLALPVSAAESAQAPHWEKIGRRFYWIQEDGTVLKKGGWHVLDGARYFLTYKSGRRWEDWLTTKGKKYYFEPG